MCVCMYVCMCYVCMYVYVCVYVCIIMCEYICMYLLNMVYCLLHYLCYNSNTTSLVNLFGIVVIFVTEISFTLRLTLQMLLS